MDYFQISTDIATAIVSKSYILTATQCVDKDKNTTYIVRVGTTSNTWYEDTYRVDKIYIHPNYTNLRNEVDSNIEEFYWMLLSLTQIHKHISILQIATYLYCTYLYCSLQ